MSRASRGCVRAFKHLWPFIGGLLTDYGSNIIPGIEGWRWVFYVNLPFGILALWFIITRMPPLRPAETSNKLDILSAFFLIMGLVPLVLALQLDKTQYPWTSTTSLTLFAIAAVGLILFIVRSLSSSNPILDLKLFNNPVFRTGNIALFFLGAGFLSLIIFLPRFMVNVLGVSATKAGVSLIPLSMGLVFGAIMGGQLVSRIGRYRLLMLIGISILLVGLYLLSTMTVDVPYWQVTFYMVICGLGIGPSFPLYTLAIQNAVPFNKLGQATSASQFFRQIGGTVGAAIMGTVLAGSLAASFQDNATQFASFGEAPSLESRSGGIDTIAEGIQQQFASQYQLIEKAFEGDAEAIAAVKASPFTPEEVKGRIDNVGAIPAAMKAGILSTIKGEMDAQAEQVMATVTRSVKEAFAKAVTKIYFYTIFVIIIGGIFSFFIPELPLHKTNDRPVAEVPAH
ncbi:MAG: MFS transporter [Deinococcales bacterium]